MNPLLDIFKDLWGYAKTTKKIYLSLLIAFLLLLGAIIVLTEGSAIMPFIYAVF